MGMVCTPGYTAQVRPPASYTTALKVKQMAALKLGGKPSDYEEDHKVPLELGGAPRDELNLWPEPWPDAHKKDQLENAWHRSVCDGRSTLARAQDVFLKGQWASVSAP